MSAVMKRIADRALQVHGSFGLSDEAPFVHMLLSAYVTGFSDGPSEVHKSSLARALLKGVEPAKGVFPSYSRSLREAAAKAKHAEVLKSFGRI